MPLSNISLTLSFPSDYGRFTIRPDEGNRDLFALTIQEERNDPLPLGHYRSINDAVFAVSNQETGFLVWDSLGPKDLPHRVHDITCWEFEEFSGTNKQKLCS
jgi:hypothetical protein